MSSLSVNTNDNFIRSWVIDDVKFDNSQIEDSVNCNENNNELEESHDYMDKVFDKTTTHKDSSKSLINVNPNSISNLSPQSNDESKIILRNRLKSDNNTPHMLKKSHSL